MDRRRYFDIMGAAPTAVTIVTTIEPAGEVEPAAPAISSPDALSLSPSVAPAMPTPGAPATPPSVVPAIPLPGAPATPPPVAAPEARGRPVGLTVSAVTSISAEPPILAICLDLRSRTLPIVLRAGRFAVNFLRGDQAELAARFAAPLADRFAGVHWRPGALGVPILVDAALAHAECLVEGRFVVGDHVVVLGRVVDGAPPPAGSRPLMYFRHGFSAWAGPIEDARNGSATTVGATATPPADVPSGSNRHRPLHPRQ